MLQKVHKLHWTIILCFQIEKTSEMQNKMIIFLKTTSKY